jgi:hypothetical protein
MHKARSASCFWCTTPVHEMSSLQNRNGQRIPRLSQLRNKNHCSKNNSLEAYIRSRGATRLLCSLQHVAATCSLE